MRHECGMCYETVEEHTSQCTVGEGDTGWHDHWPALCCAGCPCGSFEEVHPVREPTPDEIRTYRLDATDPCNASENRREWLAHVLIEMEAVAA